MIYGLLWITTYLVTHEVILHYVTRDCITPEIYWRITPIVTKNLVIHGNLYISVYVSVTDFQIMGRY